MRLMNFNYCTQSATTITASSQNSSFPVSNLKNPFRSKRWRSTGVTSEWLVFDLSTTEAIDSVVLLWSKEDGIRLSGSATVRIQANATNVWTSPALDQAMTIDNTYMMASYFFSTDHNYRYWRVLIADPSNTVGYVELGVAWLGKEITIDNAQNGFKFTLMDQSKQTKTDFGHVYTDQYPQIAVLDFSYQNLPYSSIQVLDNLYRSNGSSSPILVTFDETEIVFSKNHFLIYGLMKNQFPLQHVMYNILNAPGMTVTELA